MELYDNEYSDALGKRWVTLLANMANGDLVWMRNTQGIYYLCRVNGPWEYSGSSEFKEVDIVNYRKVLISEVGVEMHVPGKVIAAFATPRVIQPIKDEIALAVSTLIWNKLTDDHLPVASLGSDIFCLISPKDCEDLIAAYLQMKGWIVYPTRRRSDISGYGFVLRHKLDFKEAVVQVRTGSSPIDLGDLPSTVNAAFVFQTNEQYVGKNPKAVIIRRSDVLDFISKNPRLVPDVVAEWVKFVQNIAGWRSDEPHHFPVRQ